MHMNPLLKIVFAVMILAAIVSFIRESTGHFILDLLWSA